MAVVILQGPRYACTHEYEEPDQVAVAVMKDATGKGASPSDGMDAAFHAEVHVGNPVSRARRAVELEVPESQRGPGWDRHWRELEAYVDARGYWSKKSE